VYRGHAHALVKDLEAGAAAAVGDLEHLNRVQNGVM
jgi:hypothetical protein